MSIIREAVEYIVKLGEAQVPIKVGEIAGMERWFWKGEMKTVLPNRVEALSLCTLGGLESAFRGPDKLSASHWVVKVNSPTNVSIDSVIDYIVPGKRETFATASPQLTRFKFNAYMDQEAFLIGLLACFADADQRADVIAVAGNLRSESSIRSEDDGVTQQASIKKGARLEFKTIQNPVTLRPFRTFPELEQPQGRYIFRVRREDDDSPPEVGLFEVYDGQWQLEAMATIADWFQEHLADITVIR